MAESQHHSLLADDELALALHEIESAALQPASAPAEPPATQEGAGSTAPTDGSPSAAHAGVAPPADVAPPPAAVAPEETPTEPPATNTHSGGHNALLDESELNAALAELDSLPPEALAAIPDLDEPEPGAATDESPAEAPPPDSKPAASEAAPPKAEPEAGVEGAVGGEAASAGDRVDEEGGEPAGGKRKIRFAINKKPPPSHGAAPAGQPSAVSAGDAPDADANDAPSDAEQASPVDSLEALAAVAPDAPPAAAQGLTFGRRVYRAADWAMEMLNRPFARIPPGLRDIIGALALTTLGVSLLSCIVMPFLLPHRDAVDLLAVKIDRLRHPPAVAAPAHGEAAAEDAQATSGHDEPAAPAHDAPKSSPH